MNVFGFRLLKQLPNLKAPILRKCFILGPILQKPIMTQNSDYDSKPTNRYANYPPALTRSRSILQESTKTSPCITVGLRPTLEVFESSNPLEFKVIFLGEPLPLITWRKDDKIITTNIKSKLNCSVLSLDSVQAEYAGLYSCIVENPQGKVETRCQLSVLPKRNSSSLMQDLNPTNLRPCPPMIIDHLKCATAEDGEEIELACKIVCPSSSFDVVWIHNGKEIKPSKDFQYHHVDNLYKLKIPELFPEDSGIYTCEAFNDIGETFTTCSLYVTCPRKDSKEFNFAFKTFPKSTSVTRGAPVVVQAELNPGCDRQVTWIKDGVVIDQTNVINNNKVQFSIVESGLRDSGLYEMHAKINGEEQIAAFAIIVL